ncbi:FAD-binding protein [Sphingosinicella terrae]|uniref:FAD-binding protein n=1 Tax=Sphingosinicella terrae TaxID=2172047 RepID=UPI0013B3CF96|nr:FAD-binding protein [Sphingosinicella terrae]
MPADEFLKFVEGGSWTNFHATVTVPIKGLWRIRNPSPAASLDNMRTTAQRLQRLIRHAIDRQVRLRAVGSRWSFSDIAAAEDGWALQTSQLNHDFIVGPALCDAAFDGDPASLVLAQAGASVAEINLKIEKPSRRRSFRTSGASNGQTIGGMIGTGVHGSAVDMGAFESEVVGLQLLTGSRNLWLENPDRPIMSAQFAAKLDAELVRDRLLFRAALVGLGALGIVHSVMLRTVPTYLLRSYRRKMEFAEVEFAMNSLSFDGVPLPRPAERPYFFQVVVHPDPKERIAYVTTRYREECPPGHRIDPSLKSGYDIGNDLPALFSKLVDALPAVTPALVKLAMAQQLAPFEDRLNSPGEAYTYTTSKPGSAGAALAVPANRLSEALALARQAYQTVPGTPATFACRFATASPGLLSFVQYARTCIIDIDGVENSKTRRVMEAVRSAFDANDFPYSQHWGKLNALTAERVRASYGDKVDAWNLARATLLPSPAERFVFSTQTLEKAGLCQ